VAKWRQAFHKLRDIFSLLKPGETVSGEKLSEAIEEVAVVEGAERPTSVIGGLLFTASLAFAVNDFIKAVRGHHTLAAASAFVTAAAALYSAGLHVEMVASSTPSDQMYKAWRDAERVAHEAHLSYEEAKFAWIEAETNACRAALRNFSEAEIAEFEDALDDANYQDFMAPVESVPTGVAVAASVALASKGESPFSKLSGQAATTSMRTGVFVATVTTVASPMVSLTLHRSGATTSIT